MPIRILSSDLQKKSKRELNEVPKRVQEDLMHVQEWIAKQPHLNVRNDDQWLLSFLRGCKFSLQRTKEKLDKFYTMRSLLPEFFSNRDPLLPEIQQVLEAGLMLPLPKTTKPNGPRIILIRCDRIDPNIVRFINVVKASLMIIDILMNEDDNFIVAGQLGFIDLKGMTVSHAVQIYFYKEKDVDSLYKAIPHSLLPKEYGGDGGSLEEITTEWKRKVESYRDWFLEDAKYYADETKRLGEPKTSDCMFGTAGSFRKLNID